MTDGVPGAATSRASGASWDGPALLAAFDAAATHLERHAGEINGLNVFPVPDGDTGTNMSATLRAAVSEARASAPAGHGAGLAATSGALSFGALMGARGNSGVILSQILRGFAEELGGGGTLDGPALARALAAGSRAADSAVGSPVEGTILTVAREAAQAAGVAADARGDLISVLRESLAASHRAVARTPDLLPILREAGVVDAGGQGYYRLLQALHLFALGQLDAPPMIRHVVEWQDDPSATALEGSASRGSFGYETVFVVEAEAAPLDPEAMRRRLELIAESVLVAGDERIAKVHAHNDRPQDVLGFGLSQGRVTGIRIEHLDGQGSPHASSADRGLPASRVLSAPPTTSATSVVSVGAGDGLARVMRELGAEQVVGGARGGAPSVAEIVEAIRATRATQVVVLANDPNVVPAARQAAAIEVDRVVQVVATRNAAEGIASLLVFDADEDADRNSERMARAFGEVQTLGVTEAVRDARVGGREIRMGQVIALDPDEGLLAVETDAPAAALAGVRRFEPGYELLTIYRGEDASLEEAQRLAASFRETFAGTEVELVDGGQPHYCYLVSAE